MSCVNIKSKEFKDAAERLNLSSGTLEMIVHEYQNTVGNEDTFPNDGYIQSKLQGKSHKLSDSQEKLWEQRYSEPKEYTSKEDADNAVIEALRFFERDSVVLYQDNSGKYILRVAKPSLDRMTEGYSEREQTILNALPLSIDSSTIFELYKSIDSNNPYHQMFKQLVDILWSNNIPIDLIPDFKHEDIASIPQRKFKSAPITINPERLLGYIMREDSSSARGTMMRIITHELVHALTAELLETNSSWSEIRGFDKAQEQFAKDIESLYEEVKKAIGEEGWYGLKNKKEFIAEALTNSKFQIRLSKIKSKNNRNAFQKLVDSIVSMFNTLFEKHNIDIKSSVLEDILIVSQDYFNYAKKGFNIDIDNFEDSNYYIKSDLAYLPYRNLNIGDTLSGNVGEQISRFKEIINKAVEEYNAKHHYDGGNKTTARKHFSEKIKDNTAYSKFITTLSDKIISKLEKEGKSIRIIPSNELSSSMAVETKGNTIILMYNPKLIAEDAERLDYIIAHELVHTVTSSAVNNVMDGNATSEEEKFVNDVWGIIKELNDKEGFAWNFGFNIDTKGGRAKHIKEFIANVMTNPNMQSHLARIKTGNKKSLWNRFIDSIRNLVSSYLGTTINDSYLEELMNTISTHIDSKSKSATTSKSRDQITEGYSKRGRELVTESLFSKDAEETLRERIEENVRKEIQRLEKIIEDHNTVKHLIEQSIRTNGISLRTKQDVDDYNEAYGTNVEWEIGAGEAKTNTEDLKKRLTEIKDPNYARKEVQRLKSNLILSDAIARQNAINKDLELLSREDYMTEGELSKETTEETQDRAVEAMETREQQLENLMNSTLVTASEVRELANQIAYAMSDLLTDYYNNPDLLFENFPEKRTLNKDKKWDEESKKKDRKKIRGMSRIELMNFVGMDNIKALLKNKFDPRNAKYSKLSTMMKAKLISRNWEALIALSKTTFNTLEGVEEKNADDFNGFEDNAEIEEAEGNLQEHWQEEMRTRDIAKSLTQLVRNYLRQCYVLEYTGETDENGNKLTRVKENEFGIKLRVNETDAIRSILRWGLGSRDLRELAAKLKEKSNENPWLNQLIDKLNPDATVLTAEDRYFQSQFWSVFNRNFQSYYIVKADGEVIRFMPVNDDLTLRNTVNSIETMFRLGEHPLMNINKGVNKSKLEELEEKYKKLKERLSDKSLDIAADLQPIELLKSILKIIGFEASEDYIRRAIADDNFNKSLNSLSTIIEALKKNVDNKEYNPFEFGNKQDSIIGYLRSFLSPYVSYIEDTSVNSFYDSGKMYQSYVIPSYLTKLMNKFSLSEEQFLEFVEKEYGKYPWFKMKTRDITTGWRNPWLERMVRDPKARKIFKHQVMLNYGGKSYMKNLSSSEYTISLIAAYFTGSTNTKGSEVPAWFRVPMLSNKASAKFIRFYSQRGDNYQEILLDGFKKMFDQEVSRIQTVRRRNLSKSDPRFIKSFDSNGKRFVLFDFMNEYLDGKSSTTKYGKLLNRFIEGKEKLTPEEEVWLLDETKKIIAAEINRIADSTIEEWNKSGILGALKSVEGISKDSMRDQLVNYIWNDKFASMNILELTIVDPAYYKDAEDLQKRLAQIHTPGVRPNIYAKDSEGREVTDGIHRTIILNDLEDFISNVIDNITEVFDVKIRNAKSDEERIGIEALKDSIVKQFKGINVTDAQGYCSPTAYRKKAIMLGKWSEEQEDVYKKLLSGDFTYSDLKVAFQPLKPFIYSNIDTKVSAEGAPLDILKTGVQIKNSEYLIVLADAILRGANTSRPNILKVLFDVMEESQLTEEVYTNSKGEKKSRRVPAKNGIDTINFASTVKTGLHAAIDLNEFLNKEGGEIKAKEALKGVIYQEDGKYNTEYVYEMPYEDYAVPQEVPKHFLEHSQIMGSQARYLLVADLEPGATFTIEGKEYTREQFIEEYEKTIAENIEISIENLALELHLGSKSVKERNIAISKILQKECENPRYGIDLLQACSVDKDGKFRVPLSDPIQAKRIEQMINSIIKNRINKQEIAGGPVVQVSNYGLSETLNIRFKDKNGKLLVTKKEFEVNEELKSSYKSYEEYVRANQAGIAYFEVLAPFYLRDVFSNFSNKDGSIDIKTIENLTDKDGNKVGEELLKMIGYRIPTEALYSIAPLKVIGFLPKEAGEGIMLPYDITTITGSDFDIDKEYLMTKVYNIKKRDRKTLFGTIYDKLLKEYEESTGKTASYALKSKIKDEINMFLDNPEQLKYSSKLSEKIWNIYKKEAFYVEFPKMGKGARDNHIIDMFYGVLTHESSAEKMLNPGGFEEQKRMGYIAEALRNPNNKYTYEELLKLDTNKLKEISYISKNLTDIRDHIQFYKQNSAAATLIGIFAVNNIAHAVYQSGKTPLYIDIAESCQSSEPFTIAGVTFGGNMKVDPTYDIEGNLVTKTLGSLIASSVDAAKDPVLNLMNINSKTATILTTLIRLGMPFRSAALFLSQKVITDILETYDMAALSTPKSLRSIINKKIEALESDELIDDKFEFSKEELTLDELVKGVSKNNTKSDYKVLLSLNYILDISEDMESTTLVSRFNSINNAVGPLIIDNLMTEEAVNNFSENFRFREGDDYTSIDISDILADHPILKGFYKSFIVARSVFSDLNMLTNSNGFRGIVFNENYEGRVHNALFSNRKLLSKLSDFYQSYLLVASGVINPSELRYYVDTFPADYIKSNLKERYPDNKLIQSISYTISRTTGKVSIELKTTGMTTAEKEELSSAWVDLYKKNSKLAIALFKYNFFKGGIAFSPKTFMGLLPIFIKDKIEGYYETYSLNPSIDEDIVMDQFVRNNWFDESLVPFKHLSKLGGIFGKYGTFIITTEEGIRKMNGITYFRTEIKGEPTLFKLATKTEDQAVYEKVEPLGGNGEYLEISTEAIKGYVRTSIKETPNPSAVENNTEIEDQTPTEDSLESKEKDYRDLMYKAITRTRDMASAESYRKNYKEYSEKDKKAYEKGMKKYLNSELAKQGYELNEEDVEEIYKQFCK